MRTSAPVRINRECPIVTQISDGCHRGRLAHVRQFLYKEDLMPVLMIALFALVCFGLIGILLAAAVVCEPKKPVNSNKHAAPKHAA